ncbi:MAG: FixH family protein [Pseudomonadota bacterium]
MSKAAAKGDFTGWHALAWLMGFFALMFAVNGIFLYHAITSFPGEDIPKSYVQGISYNTVLDERAAQAKLGWTAELGVENEELIFRLFDKDESPIAWRKVGLKMRRLATTSSDTDLILLPGSPGEYRVDIDALATGEWEAVISVYAVDDQNVEFTATKTLSLK